jgi:transposase-like protein
MRKNQKYTQEEMYLAIELWEESGLSQKKYCRQNQLSFSTFKYWLRKYSKEKAGQESKSISFIQVHIPKVEDAILPVTDQDGITIIYPSGTQVSCPVNISTEKLCILIRI